MKEMSQAEQLHLRVETRELLGRAASYTYVDEMLNHVDPSTGNTLAEDVLEDVKLNSDWETRHIYATDDIKLAIGRAFLARLR